MEQMDSSWPCGPVSNSEHILGTILPGVLSAQPSPKGCQRSDSEDEGPRGEELPISQGVGANTQAET